MPRGTNPNSKKALAQHRKKTQFHGETAVKAAKKSNEVQAETKVFAEAFRKACMEHPEMITKAATTILRMAACGNIKACELIMKIMGEDPARKLEIAGANGEPIKYIIHCGVGPDGKRS